MRAYRDVVPGRVGGLNLASAERGPYRLRAVPEAPYPGTYGVGLPASILGKIGASIAALARTLACALVLLAWLVASYLYRDTPITLFGIGTGWLSISHVLVPVGFYFVFLTNRRYGPAYAFAQIVVTLALISGLVLFAHEALNEVIPLESAPSIREAVGFGAAFFLAGLISIVAFDGARGPRWWTAPLIGFLASAITFAVIFYPAVYAGTEKAWLGEGISFLGLIAGESLLLLIPFWAMRRMVPPVAGFGGY